jgi:hypothetical protein
MKMTGQYIGCNCLVGMAAGLVSIALENFVTVRMLHILPMPYFLMFPILMIVELFVLSFGISLGIFVFECSSDFKAKWRPKLGVRPIVRKYWKMKVEAMQPLKIHGEWNGFNLFVLKKSTLATYWYAVMINFSVTAILCIPESALR